MGWEEEEIDQMGMEKRREQKGRRRGMRGIGREWLRGRLGRKGRGEENRSEEERIDQKRKRK